MYHSLWLKQTKLEFNVIIGSQNNNAAKWQRRLLRKRIDLPRLHFSRKMFMESLGKSHLQLKLIWLSLRKLPWLARFFNLALRSCELRNWCTSHCQMLCIHSSCKFMLQWLAQKILSLCPLMKLNFVNFIVQPKWWQKVHQDAWNTPKESLFLLLFLARLDKAHSSRPVRALRDSFCRRTRPCSHLSKQHQLRAQIRL